MLRTPAWIVELAILVMVLVVLGSVLAPAHRISIWMDDEFTGFVPPISNRIAAGMVLYEKGGHLPIPPLSLVFFHLVSSGEATWFLGSLWNYIFQCAPLLLLYATLTTLVSRPIPFLAALSGIPIFLAMGKSVLYDSFSQFLVASVMAATIYALGLHRSADQRCKTAGIILAGCLVGTLLLSKQSTGMGTALGAVAVFGLFPRKQRWRDRAGRLGVFLIAAGGCFLFWCLLLSEYVSVSGMIVDVFLTGSEPKGGPMRMLANLVRYGKHLVFSSQ